MIFALGACSAERDEGPDAGSPSLSPIPAVSVSSAPVSAPSVSGAPPAGAGGGAGVRARAPLVVMAAGDVNLGRAIGRRILQDSSFDPFDDLRPLLAPAHLTFANLESPLSDQNGETEDPERPLAFVGPPDGAALIARAPFGVVSVANNHVWDYRERGFLDTLDALESAGVRYAGASRRAGEQYRPAVLSVNGWSIALFAVTHLWNPGTFHAHEARDRVAWADDARLLAEVKAARPLHDLVLVSYHGGREYSDIPAQEPRDFAKAVMAAGADAVIAHHPHVPQGVGWFAKRPVFYSLGNLVFGKHRDFAWTARGFVARLTFDAERRVSVAACPYRIDAGVPRRATQHDWPGWDSAFRRHLRKSSAFVSVGGTAVDPPDELGCLPLRPGAD